MPRLKEIWRNAPAALEKFFYEPASARPFAVLRIGIALSLLFQWNSVLPHLSELVGSTSLVQESVSAYFYDPGLPNLGQFMDFSIMRGVSETNVIESLFTIYGIALVGLAWGWKTQFFAWLAFALNVLFYASSPTTIYGADEFARNALFYLALSPSGASFSIDNWIRPRGPSVRARFILRLFQLHLCIAYFASGLEKAVGPQWQSGEIIWRALNLPVYMQYDFTWIANFPLLMMLFAWGTLVLEIGYPIFVWPKRTRYVWVAAILSLHLGIGIFLGLWVFSFVMCTLTLSAFGISAQALPEKTTSTFKPPSSETSNVISA